MSMIGLAIAQGCIRAVGLRGGSIRWASETQVEESEALGAAIARVLSSAPRARWRRPGVSVALGPAATQVKQLGGLPPLSDHRVLARIVQEGAGRFFLRNGAPLVTALGRVTGPGQAWAAAFDRYTVHEVERGCRAARVRLRGIVPAVAAIGAALEGDRILWPDGDLHTEVVLADRQLVSVRRLWGGAPEGGQPTPTPALARVGEQAWRFADAYGAAVLSPGGALVIRPGRGASDSSGVPMWRLGLAVTAALCSVAAVLLLPGFAALRRVDEASAQLASLAAQRQAAVTMERDLGRVTAALNEAAAFDSTRYAVTFLLSDLSRALPEGAALVAFRVDSAGGHIVALAPRAAGVLTPLERVPGLIGPEIVGPVTREMAGGRELERVTIRFRVDRAERRRQAPSENPRRT